MAFEYTTVARALDFRRDLTGIQAADLGAAFDQLLSMALAFVRDENRMLSSGDWHLVSHDLLREGDFIVFTFVFRRTL